ncbi:MAG: prolyl oligopeptidase family serine peptidase [Blastocatellia bacterium]
MKTMAFRKMFFLSIALTLICPVPASAQPVQSKRGLLPTDLSAIKDVSDAQISPNGSKVVYVVSEAAPDRSRAVSRLWIVPAAGGEPKRLTTCDASESTPRWSPDGKWIAFYSNRSKRDGLWIVSAEGGEPRLVTHTLRANFHLKGAGESFAWAPDGKRIAFLSATEILNEAPPAAANDPKLAGLPPQALRPLTRDEIDKLPIEIREMIFRAQSQAFGQKPSSPLDNAISVLPDDPRVITRLQYKSRTSFSDNLRSHIFAVDIETRRLRQLTEGLFYEHSINWSPKGDEIVFVSNREPDPDRINNTDLFTVNVNTFAIRQLTKTKGCEWQPVYSPDGSKIAYLATKRGITTIDSVAEDSHAYIISAQGGEPIEVSQGVDRRVSIVKWLEPSAVIFAVADQGATYISSGTTGGNTPFISGKGANSQITSFSTSKNTIQAAIYSRPTNPSELTINGPGFCGGPPGPAFDKCVKTFTVRKELNVNKPLLDSLILSEPREFKFNNEGFEIQGWVYAPPNSVATLENQLMKVREVFGNENPRTLGLRKQIEERKKANPNEKYPVILSIHGGPHGMYGYSFNPTVQAMAAHGYAVLLINPRGSSGYGQKFADGCVNDWGGGDYRDLMKGVDEALARFPFLDKDRMGVMGGSYGGYMTNWVVTQTDRFKAAVASASLSNLISFYSTSLYQDLIHAEFNGHPWENGGDNFNLLWDRSPLKHIKKAKTPLLLLHGENDNDVHITQAEEMYTAMRMRNIECVFVRYPREGHGLREPRHREDSLARTLQWFDRFLKK